MFIFSVFVFFIKFVCFLVYFVLYTHVRMCSSVHLCDVLVVYILVCVCVFERVCVV